MKKIDPVKKFYNTLGEATSAFYDKVLLNSLTKAPYGYKYVNLPVYKFYRTIKVKENCFCEECGNEHFNIVERKIGVKQIGTERVRVPKNYEDFIKGKHKKPKEIKFSRYRDLEIKRTTGYKIILPKNTKFVKGLPKIDKKHFLKAK